MNKYGESLKRQRENNNLTQSQLARDTGLKQSMISWWEAGNGLPNIDFCVRLADYYNISLDELVDRDYTSNASVSKFTLSNEEMEIIKNYRMLSPDLKKMIKETLNTFLKSNKYLHIENKNDNLKGNRKNFT
jgi:transcriptional regulator with XRE-family HTH domain